MAASKQVNGRKAGPRADAAGDAQVAGDPVERRDHEQTEQENSAPTVGKTGGRGARAERPSEGGSDRKAKTAPVETTRVAKPPAETPKAGGLSRPNAGAWRSAK